jgi:hypothetical protein
MTRNKNKNINFNHFKVADRRKLFMGTLTNFSLVRRKAQLHALYS